ncbi:MAG: T9SS type A sorting domain-containing protein [Bacteroidetes bacterium]|nr:T9SS type A sorting domain-containing protein [Bacteroidota bacterium]
MTRIKQIIAAIILMTAGILNAQQTTVEQKLLLVSNSYQNGGEYVVDFQIKGSNLTAAKTLASLNADIVYDSSAIRFISGSDWMTGLSAVNGYSTAIKSHFIDDWNTNAVRILVTAPEVNNGTSATGYDLETSYRTVVRLHFQISDYTKTASLTIKGITNQAGFFSNANNNPNTFDITNIALSDPINITESPLPVNLASFTQRVSERNVTLNWTTTQEINNRGFEIQRKSTSDNEWTILGFVNGSGSTNIAKNYTYEDRKLGSGKYQYRLKQVDNNGGFSYHTLNGSVEIGLPSKFTMSQNYPNPFNPSTKIDYDVPADSRVKIVLFDETGKEVATVLNESKRAGSYTVNYQPQNLSSGIYFYRMTASSNGNENVVTKKMSFIK